MPGEPPAGGTVPGGPPAGGIVPGGCASHGTAGAAANVALLAGLLAAAALATTLTTAPLEAQVFDAPSFVPPEDPGGLGVYLIEQEGVGGIVTWRRQGEHVGWGVRGGLLDEDDEVGIVGGLDLWGPIHRADDDFPLDVSWVSGVGLGAVPDRDAGLFRIPGGVSVGRSFGVADDLSLTPYVHPRLALDVFYHEEPGPGDDTETDTELNFDVDLGADLRIPVGLTLRVGLTLGERETVGVGVVF